VGLRITEVDQDAIPHVLRNEAAEATHGLGDALLIGRNDLAEVFRVHAGRKCRRTDKVAEHDRDLAALYQQAVEDLARQLETADGIKRRGMMLAFLMRTSMWELLVQSSFDGR
jgi:hypothetical protein